jgi:hypothetical protein
VVSRLKWIIGSCVTFVFPLVLISRAPLAVPSWGTQILLLAALLVLVGAATCHHFRRLAAQRARARSLAPDPPMDVLQFYATKPLEVGSYLQSRVFAMGIVRPAYLVQRVTEEYEMRERTLAQRTSIEVQIPRRLIDNPAQSNDENSEVTPAAIGTVWYPARMTSKGTLHDNLTICDESNAGVHSLSYIESLTLIATVLRDLLNAAYARHRKNDKEAAPPKKLPGSWRRAELAAFSAICQPGDPSIEAASAAHAIETLHGGHPSALMFIADFVQKLAGSDVTVVPMRTSQNGRFVINIHQTIIPPARESSKTALTRFLHAALGPEPAPVFIAVPTAGVCQSYHMRVTGPAGTYLSEQELVGAEHLLAASVRSGSELTHVQFSQPLGQPYAHFYARSFPRVEANGSEPRILLRFLETPPGSVFRAAVTALATFVLVWLVAYVTPPGSTMASDAPAFLLVFPAAAAAWLGVDTPAGRLFEATLAARIYLIVTAVTSVAASGLFLIYQASAHTLAATMPHHMSMLGVRQWAWVALMAIALVNAVIATYQYLMNALSFVRVSSNTTA